jgi:hypothetical protein
MHCFSLVDLRCQWYPNTSRRHRTQDELRAHLLQLLAERAQGAVELAPRDAPAGPVDDPPAPPAARRGGSHARSGRVEAGSMTLPAQQHSQTSIAAAEAYESRASILRERVLALFLGRGELGYTDDELFQALPGERESSIRPRRVELEDLGAIVATGETRATRSKRQASVYVLRQHASGQLWLSLPNRRSRRTRND